jgi:hypothetical protein
MEFSELEAGLTEGMSSIIPSPVTIVKNQIRRTYVFENVFSKHRWACAFCIHLSDHFSRKPKLGSRVKWQVGRRANIL